MVALIDSDSAGSVSSSARETEVLPAPGAADAVLEWAFYADDAGAIAPPWPSLAVCVDVLFDDGGRLSDAAPLDRFKAM